MPRIPVLWAGVTAEPVTMATQTAQIATNTAIDCTECSGRISAVPTLAGEILDCPDCGAELEVRSLQPLVLALAPEVEEDWGE